MGSLAKRVISAAVGILVIAGLCYFYKTNGLLIVTFTVVFIASFEFANLIYPPSQVAPSVRYLFLCFVWLTIFANIFYETIAIPTFLICNLALISVLILRVTGKQDLERTLKMQAMSALGLIYCASLPSMAAKVLFLPNGIRWFLIFLAIVFTGDTFAYFAGILFGRKKLLAIISPKKTISGSLGGLAGSMLAGALGQHFFLSHSPAWAVVALALITGICAQMGDMFESLMKRVAHVKDSGNIMPGHGGFLDRVDGVYFSAPVFYLVTKFFL